MLAKQSHASLDAIVHEQQLLHPLFREIVVHVQWRVLQTG